MGWQYLRVALERDQGVATQGGRSWTHTTCLAWSSILGVLTGIGFLAQPILAQPQSAVERGNNLDILSERAPRCDLDQNGACDQADIWLFESLSRGAVVRHDDALARADANGDGVVTLRDMRELFPRSEFPHEITWLDLYERAERLVTGDKTIADVEKEEKQLLSQDLTRFEAIDKMTKGIDEVTVYAATAHAKEALVFAEQHFGPYDYKILKTVELLGTLYFLQDAHAQVELMNRRQLDIIKYNDGLDSAMEFAEAERLIKDEIAGEQEQGHSTATSLLSLAGLYYAQAKYEEAELWFRQGFELLEDGTVPPDRVALWMDHYADVLQKAGKSGEAVRFRERAVQLRGVANR